MTTWSPARGQALVEFALVVPIFLILMFGIIDFGRYVYTANALSNSAREAARIGSVGNRPTECNGLSRQVCVETILASRSWGVSVVGLDPDVTCARVAPSDPTPNAVSMSTCRTGDLLTVRAESTFTLLTPIIAQFIGNLVISGETMVTVNQ